MKNIQEGDIVQIDAILSGVILAIFESTNGLAMATVEATDGEMFTIPYGELELSIKNQIDEEALDRILEFQRLKRDDLFEYPYNERDSTEILFKSRRLRNDLFAIFMKGIEK